MSRFAEPQHADFRALNDSIAFDWRLGPYDVEQSRAHARMLAATGIISEADRDELLGGLDRVAEELDAGDFPFQDADEDIHMAVERRLTEIVGAVGGRLHTARWPASTTRPTGAWSPRSWASPPWRRTRSTRCQTATSCSTSWPRRPPAPPTCRAWAPRSCSGPRRSSASARWRTPGPRPRRSCRRRRTRTAPSCCAPRRRAWWRTWGRC